MLRRFNLVMSSVMLVICVIYLLVHFDRVMLDPIMGIMTISTMTITCLSSYQIVISTLMIWQKSQKQPKIFFFSIWFVSHLSIITLYAMMALAIVVIHMANNSLAMGLLYLFYSCAYLGTLIYFEVVMNSYLNSVLIPKPFPEMSSRQLSLQN
ncbi:uncharacterized protein LOC128674192 isoform X2 [Plodia interpunctella]|uniref:uncharacterized protein LOC128674192 isoform X2 n=1 Tax=Plodia interpunctella TaxID=58824 RepID=UPI002367BDF6|nr:uncharacterized protein LOC128674192 isoform X2 [Plodia interpunctella]